MSLSEDGAFAYESPVHSSNVLLGLNDQRQRDVLCDLTVLVEGRPFRAHRSVLAACSSYFHARVVGQAAAELRIALPEEVTVKGFEPVIQFAYTARLPLSRDSVEHVCRCVAFLGVRDIEDSCFRLLKAESSGPAADQPECPGKQSAPAPCPEPGLGLSPEGHGDLGADELALLGNKRGPRAPCEPRGLQGDSEAPPLLPDRTLCSGALPSLCPKYRKFQKAFGTDRARPAEAGAGDVLAPLPPSPAPENGCPGGVRAGADLPGTLKCEESGVKMELEDAREDAAPPCPPEVAPLPQASSSEPPGLCCPPLLPSCEQHGDLGFARVPSAALMEQPLPGPDVAEEKPLAGSPGGQGGPARSSVEREVAEHLARGFWGDVCGASAPGPVQLLPAGAKDGSEHSPSQKRSECPWLGIRISESPELGPRTFATLSSVSCPFISTLSAEGRSGCLDAGPGGCASGSPQEPCSYACVITLGEDSETDTEGDSEPCSAREQECEVKLPFNAQRIISLSRNDFQSLLKMHRLTPEQLDCVHDIRRRSKNRIAAQRCRKRKLDCIQNLESEIEKLQHEKESLLQERDRILSTLGETRRSLTGLCQQVCREAALSREQIQVLAKYSASDCPLSLLISGPEGGAPGGALGPPPNVSALEGLPAAPPPGEPGRGGPRGEGGGSGGQESRAAPEGEGAGLGDQCRPSAGISEFCQQMTDKCTTTSEPRPRPPPTTLPAAGGTSVLEPDGSVP